MSIVVSAILGSLALIGWLNHLRNQRFRAAVQAKTERFNKIIDRFGNDQDLLTFLQSERGLAILNTLTSTGKSTKVPIMVTACSGIVAVFIGIGAWLLALTFDLDFVFPAVFMSCIGLGLLTAAGVSYSLARKWDLFEEEDPTLQPISVPGNESETVKID